MPHRTGRWPRSVYGHGTDPDPRFSFANERTFLAWIRTALALVAAGVAVRAFELPLSPGAHRALPTTLLALGLLCTLSAWVRWTRAERAMRRGLPLPDASAAGLLAVGLAICTLLLAVGLR